MNPKFAFFNGYKYYKHIERLNFVAHQLIGVLFEFCELRMKSACEIRINQNQIRTNHLSI